MPPPIRGQEHCGDRGGYGFPPDYYGSEDYYHDYYDYDYHDYYGGYEDPHHGYAVRKRGERMGGQGAPPPLRGQGAPLPRYRFGYSQRVHLWDCPH